MPTVRGVGPQVSPRVSVSPATCMGSFLTGATNIQRPLYTGEFFAAKISEWVPSLKQLMFFSGIFCGIVNQVPDFFSSEINRRRASLFLGKTRGISFLFEVGGWLVVCIFARQQQALIKLYLDLLRPIGEAGWLPLEAA